MDSFILGYKTPCTKKKTILNDLVRSYLIAYKSSYLCTLILKIKLEDKSAPFTGKPFTGKLRNTRQILKHKIKCSGTEIFIYKNLA